MNPTDYLPPAGYDQSGMFGAIGGSGSASAGASPPVNPGVPSTIPGHLQGSYTQYFLWFLLAMILLIGVVSLIIPDEQKTAVIARTAGEIAS